MTGLPLAIALACVAPGAPRATVLPADDLARLEQELELRPDDPGLLLDAAQAALAAGDADRAGWYATLAGRAAQVDDRRRAQVLGRIERPETALDEACEQYADRLLDFVRSCQRRKLYANAAEVLGRLEGTPSADEAARRLAAIFKNDAAVEALFATGLAVRVQPRRRLSDRQIAKLDQKHAGWEEPLELAGKHYTVITNAGYELGQRVLDAMEQTGRVYRQVFGYKTSGGTMRRCVIHLYSTRRDFEAHERDPDGNPPDPNVAGFFVPGENRVATYVEGNLAQLWETLFHECSHQFTDAVWKQDIPTWLDEGTASYFEGARLTPSGAVVPGGVAEPRLRELMWSLDNDGPDLERVVTHINAASYPGSYYSHGWGLVYFCHEFEDPQGERPYLEAYARLRDSYKGSGKHDVLARFVEFMVTDVGLEGVTTLEDFRAGWEAWMRDLARVQFGGREQAETLFARGAAQQAHGHHDRAARTYRAALDKDPRHAGARLALAGVLAELGREDEAIFRYRELLADTRAARSQEDRLTGLPDLTVVELTGRVFEALQEIDETFAGLVADLDRDLAVAAGEAARTLVEAGLPRMALLELARVDELLGGSRALDAAAGRIRTETGVDLRRWRRLRVPSDLAGWTTMGSWRGADDRLVFAGKEAIVTATWDTPLPDVHHLEAAFSLSHSGEASYVGFLLGRELEGHYTLLLAPQARFVQLGTYHGQSGSFEARESRYLEREIGAELTLALVDDGRSIEVCLDGEPVLRSEHRPARPLRGVVVQGTQAQVSLRVR